MTTMTYAAEECRTARESGTVEVMDAVFRKTILGYNEAEHHHVLSRPQLRRLLDLIDGEQGMDALLPYFRPSELGELITELLNLGLIEATSSSTWTGEMPTVAPDAMQRSLTPMQFEAARRAAMHTTMELLGDDARPYIAGLIHCHDSAMLRDAIHGIQAAVTQHCSAGAAKLLVETVRAAARLDD